MAEHNQFEIDNAWELVEFTSPRAEKQVYKINSVSKHVLFRTRVGDGNQQEWRGCNVTYESIKGQNHRTIESAEIASAVKATAGIVSVDVPAHDNNARKTKVKALDLESVAPFKSI